MVARLVCVALVSLSLAAAGCVQGSDNTPAAPDSTSNGDAGVDSATPPDIPVPDGAVADVPEPDAVGPPDVQPPVGQGCLPKLVTFAQVQAGPATVMDDGTMGADGAPLSDPPWQSFDQQFDYVAPGFGGTDTALRIRDSADGGDASMILPDVPWVAIAAILRVKLVSTSAESFVYIELTDDSATMGASFLTNPPTAAILPGLGMPVPSVADGQWHDLGMIVTSQTAGGGGSGAALCVDGVLVEQGSAVLDVASIKQFFVLASQSASGPIEVHLDDVRVFGFQ